MDLHADAGVAAPPDLGRPGDAHGPAPDGEQVADEDPERQASAAVEIAAVRDGASSGGVEAAIRRASSATGVDADFLLRTARRESSMNPAAKARRDLASDAATGID